MVRKRLLRVCVWEGVGDRTETAIYWPPLLWPSALCLSRSPGLLKRSPEAQLSAGWWLSLLQLITNWSPKLYRGSLGPFRQGVAFPTTSCHRRLWSPTHQGLQLIRGSKGPLRWDFSTTSYQQLLWTPTHRGPRGPLRPGVAFPTTLVSNFNSLTSLLDWVI